jgi:hypothetical protein
MKLKFRKTIITAAAVILLSGGAAPASSSPIYSGELTVSVGYHLFPDSSSWLEGEQYTLERDLFFRDETEYSSGNVDSAGKSRRTGMPMLTLEYRAGVEISGFRGIRFGASASYYGFTSAETPFYSGLIKYNNPTAMAPDPAVLDYQGSIDFKETFLIIAPAAGISYWYEQGFAPKMLFEKIIPYAGIDAGFTIVTGERTIRMSSDPLYVAANDTTYQVDASIQEKFFNDMGLRLVFSLGGQFRLSGPHSIDLRAGYILQETSVDMDRRGTWTESIDGAPYSRRVTDEKRNSNYVQNGLYFSIGYTVGIQ